MTRSILLLLFAGCSFDPIPGGVGGDGGTSDSPMVVDAPPGAICVGTGAFEVCTDPEVTGDITLAGSFDTAMSTSCATSQVSFTTQGLHPDVCFVIGDTITVMNLVVSGDRPLVLASQGAINILGTIDVSARNRDRGPGARNTCAAGPPPNQIAGGAGGTYKDLGGVGGDGDNQQESGGQPGAAEPTLVALRGGCPGQAGDGDQGDGGEGGGVFYAGAHTALMMASATINASGSGGEGGRGGNGGGGGFPGGGPERGGGGGGGSGGVIYLFGGDAIVATAAIVVASGGGGGGGGTQGGNGEDGGDPSMAMPAMAAPGGDGAGDGGPGFPDPTRRGQNAPQDLGGGGGGGGPGHIVTNQALAGATTVLPAP